MSLRSVMLQLRDDQIERLDAKATRAGVSKSKLVRDAVDSSLDRAVRPDVADLYAAAYPRPVAGTDEWGDLDAWHDATERDRTRP